MNVDIHGRQILIVEDNYMIASDMARVLRARGARILGPTPTVTTALALLAEAKAVDGAILDINLQEELVYPVADALQARSIPFMFATGYAGNLLPERFADVPLCQKPVEPTLLLETMAALMPPRGEMN